LRSLAESFSQRTGIEAKYRSELEGRRLPDVAETHLFRIAQEALTNAARHSQATSVSIELLTHRDRVTLSIRDNGHGFDISQRGSSRGLGLAGMETRARGCGGALTLDSAPGKGLSVEVTCPIGQ
jgi:signal transduction histidine kinase